MGFELVLSESRACPHKSYNFSVSFSPSTFSLRSQLSSLFFICAGEDTPEVLYPVAKNYKRTEAPFLTDREARLRSQTISNVEYYIHIRKMSAV